ncbi:hypothetical protein DIZ27_25290 [Streptomyces sp. NWU339]|uniref:hypothetical protein n=1 Tax=Streptomyces sp. NWU339 TaxID=2185284 RepID=UPI000D6831F4|nr:hypothetical protein [Streptomyces sp. NWU339]PWI07976.1 hypothetical protein DIZ27_25290 [Streptomyces sp. NWU339]
MELVTQQSAVKAPANRFTGDVLFEDVRNRTEPTVHATLGVTTPLATMRAALAPEVAAPTGTSRARGTVRS